MSMSLSLLDVYDKVWLTLHGVVGPETNVNDKEGEADEGDGQVLNL